jgi:hypothetical protein
MSFILLEGCSLPVASQHSGPYPRLAAATPDANLAIANQYLTDARIVSTDSFDNLRNWRVEPANSSLTDGVFQMTGTAFWHSHFSYRKKFSAGDGLMLNFEVQQANAQSEFVFTSGDWLTDSFRQFGIYAGVRPQADLFQGKADLGGDSLLGDLRLRPSVTYSLLLAVGPRGHVEAVIWDPAADTQRAVYDLLGDRSWIGRKWTFMPKANAGETIYVDNFYSIAFTDIR